MQNTPIPNTPMRFIGYVLRPFWPQVLFAFLVVTLAQLLNNSTSFILKNLVDGIIATDSHADALAVLWHWGGVYLIAMILLYASWRTSGLVGVYFLARSKAYSYRVLFEYLTKHSHEYFANRFAGAVSNKVSHASDGADGLIEEVLWHYYPSALSLIVTAILLSTANLMIGGVFIALIVVLVIINIYLVQKRRPLVIAYSTASSTLRGVAVDTVTNIAAVMQYARVPFEMSRIDRYIMDRKHKDIARDRSAELGLVLNNTLVAFFMIGIGYVTYKAFEAERMTIGDVVMTTTLLWGASYSLIFIGNILNSFIRTYGEIEEGLTEVLIPHGLTDERDAVPLTAHAGEIRFNAVDFSYDQNKVFDQFSLTIAPGERIGVVGKSGAGKTTFVTLLLRQQDVMGGSIEIDGQNIATVTQDSLRASIGVVPQEPLLFHRSLRENIAYGNPSATDEEVMSAAKLAEAHEFITSLPEGYDTLVGERGVKLSGGQRQRIAIARAMLKNAPILILDEATSALDSESEVSIQKALHGLMEGKTVIAIAHRLSTLREMDRIIVLDQGSIVEQGSHDTLVKQGGIYARLWEHQAGGFLQE